MYLLSSNGEKEAHPFLPHRETGKKVQQREKGMENEFVLSHLAGVCLSIEAGKISFVFTFDIKCGRGLSTYTSTQLWLSQAIPTPRSSILTRPFFCRVDRERACGERGSTRAGRRRCSTWIG